jgi:hypothetical protein
MSLTTKVARVWLAAAVSLAWHTSPSSTRLFVGRIPSPGSSCTTSAIRRWKGWERLHPRFTLKNTLTSIYYLGYVHPCVAFRCLCLKWGTVTGLLEEIVTGLRCPHSEPPSRRERFVTELPEDRWGEVFRFSSQSPRLRAADHRFFGCVGGRDHERFEVSKLDAG